MPSVLNEQTQFTDSAGKPLVNGKVYFGVQNADPVLNPVSIFSDRALSVAIANPQLLDALGRTANKVWVAGRYSMRVDDLNDVQIYQELDNGESPDVGVTALENVTGGNTIVAEATSTITAYEDLELYAFRAAQANTAAVTLNIDGVGAKSVVKNHDQAILAAEFEADQNIIVSYNLTDDVFEWVNQNNKRIDFYEGTIVASATQPDIWASDGNTIHISGNVQIDDFADAPNVGARQKIIFDGTPQLTSGSGITVFGGTQAIEAGDCAFIYADAVDAFIAMILKADGTAVVAPQPGLVQTAFVHDGEVATGSTVMPSDDTIPQNNEGDEYMTLAITPTDASNNLVVDIFGFFASTLGNRFAFALFRDGVADALAAGLIEIQVTNQVYPVHLRFQVAAGSTDATTFKFRAGLISGSTTITFNGISGARKFGGVMDSHIRIQEVSV